VHYAGHRAGLVVDALLGEFQTVIKRVAGCSSGFRISGSTILGKRRGRPDTGRGGRSCSAQSGTNRI